MNKTRNITNFFLKYGKELNKNKKMYKEIKKISKLTILLLIDNITILLSAKSIAFL